MVCDEDRLGQPGRVGADGHPGAGQDPVGEADPGGRVVVAGDGDHERARVAESDERLVEQLDRPGGGDGTVEEVSGDEHGVDRLVRCDLHHPVDRLGLLVEQGRLVELPSQVPVGGVQEPHAVERTEGV